jgi:predicted ester cyclase
MVCEPPHVASRLRFDCRPKGLFLGLPINGKRLVFAETSSIGTGTKELRSLVGDRQRGDRRRAWTPSVLPSGRAIV